MRTGKMHRAFCLDGPLKKISAAVLRNGWLAVLALFLTIIATSGQAIAIPASEALETCRATIGRPVVRACVQQRLHAEGGFPQQYIAACRQTATPAVKGCFQNVMKDVITDCRRTVGKPIVEACVKARIESDGRFLTEQVETCRKYAFGPVRACIWRTSGRDNPDLR